MMLSNAKSEINGTSGGDVNNGQLLHDIEAIGKALSLNKTRSSNRSKSAGRTRFQETRPYSKEDVGRGDLLRKGKKASIWNWTKPLKALTHIRDRKFHCCFYFHVHSIEGLPSYFNDLSLCVHWKRKDVILRTQPSRVSGGVADFRQTFKHRSFVYGHRSGPHHSSKYESKLFLVYASVVGAPALDLGKHLVDITNVLPLTLEELEDAKSSGKWTTSFRLSGKAKGATMNVSIGYSVIGNDSIGSNRNIDALFPSHSNQGRSCKLDVVAVPLSREEHAMLRQVGSVSSDVNLGSHLSSHSGDAEVCPNDLPNTGLEFSRSINFLYEVLDEVKVGTSEKVDILPENTAPPSTKHDLFSMSAEEHIENECDDIEFTIIEQGIEITTKEQLRSEESADVSSDDHVIETFVDDIHEGNILVGNQEVENDLKDNVYDKNMEGAIVEDCIYKERNSCTKEATLEELLPSFTGLLLRDLKDLDSQHNMGAFLELENYTEIESHYKSRKMEKSRSLDDLTESVASDFLHMLEIDNSPYHLSSDSDPGSPRERLLRQFEKEALASGSFIYDVGVKEEEAEAGCAAPTMPLAGDFSDDFQFLTISEVAEQKQKDSHSLMSKRKAKMLENLETEALMHKWGLNEMAFQYSPCNGSGGFGSPIYHSDEEPLKLPSLAEGLGPVLPTEDGGFLRSMNPRIFRNAKNCGGLIMQVSRPVVLPAEMGSDIMDILKQFAALGIEKFSFQANKLMPLDHITEKTMQDLAWQASDLPEVPQRMVWSNDEPEIEELFGKRKKLVGHLYNQRYDDMNPTSRGGEMGLECISLKDLTSLAMDKIEALAVEGLRIQSGMSGEEAPAFEMAYVSSGESFSSRGASGWRQQRISVCDTDRLLSFCLPLDEWLKLDAGMIGDEDHIDQHTKEVLAAHHAKCTELISGMSARDTHWCKASGKKDGLLENNFIKAVRVQLRDPLRNYEPVGIPMLALIQVERVYFPLKPDIYNSLPDVNHDEEDDNHCETIIKEGINDMEEEDVEETRFRIIEIHVAGLNAEPHKKKHWGSTTQQQSGCRWLLSNGMNTTIKIPISKSKAIVKSTPLATRRMNYGDTLWSISSHVCGTEANWEELSTLNSTIRNPDVIFQEEIIMLR